MEKHHADGRDDSRLGQSRKFRGQSRCGKKAKIPKSIPVEARETFEGLGLGALVCIGGDGSLSTALQLQNVGVLLGGVPIAKAARKLRTLQPDSETVASACSVGMSFGSR